MFFGYEVCPDFIKIYFSDIPVERKSLRVCSRNKEQCLGEYPAKMEDGTTKWMFLYDTDAYKLLSTQTTNSRIEQTKELFDIGALDNGIDITICKIKIKNDIYCWSE